MRAKPGDQERGSSQLIREWQQRWLADRRATLRLHDSESLS
jgi:hypothetical protein